MFPTPSDARRSVLNRSRRVTFATIPKNSSPRRPSSVFPASGYITSPLNSLELCAGVTHTGAGRDGSKPVVLYPPRYGCDGHPRIHQDFRIHPRIYQDFPKKGRKSCHQATGSTTPSAMHCHKQMGLLIYSSGTGFRSVLRHLGVGVCRAPVDTLQETLPNPIFTSIATTRANTLCCRKKEETKFPKRRVVRKGSPIQRNF